MLTAAALSAAPFAAFAQSPLSPTPMADQPALHVPSAPAAPTPAKAPAPAASTKEAAAPAAKKTTAAKPAAAPRRKAAEHKRERIVRKRRRRVYTPRNEIALSDDPTPALQPNTFYATAKASERYLHIADAGGWPRVPRDLRPGSRGPAVAALRRRLAMVGDLPTDQGWGEHWSRALTEAVKHFQFRMGLRRTGIVAGATLRALNVPANVRFKQLASTAQRLAGINFPFGDKYVVVNIPSLAVDAVQNGRVVHRYAAIVGEIDHQSPRLSTKIVAINLNPTWTVPKSIIKNEIIPKMRRDPHYLSREHIRILNYQGQEINPRSINWDSDKATNYILRQDSGAGNALGRIRLNMPNSQAVYMHDTSSRYLFAKEFRFLSHGCVRVQGVYDLAAWLLQGTPVTDATPAKDSSLYDPDPRPAPSGGAWTAKLIQEQIATGARETIQLVKPTPVIWVYMTGWASDDGTVHFRNDVYNIDTVGG